MNFKYYILTQFVLLHFTAQLSPSLAQSNREHGEQNDRPIHKFRSLVQPQIYPNTSQVHKFIKDNQYIQQWLKRSNHDVERAYRHFMEHLAWRKNEKIDEIHLENWAYYRSEFPQFLDTVDKKGRPVAEIWLSDWNIRQVVLSGQSRKLVRWMIYLLEMMQRRLFEIRANGHGNVSSAVEIIDLDGFNTWQHGCLSCIPIYMNLGRFWETHYPGIWENIYMLNVGPSFRTFLSLLGNHFSYGQQNFLKMYSSKREWMSVLDREISREQRSTRFGGRIDRSSSEE